jgi:hypothetical protein
MLTKHTKICVLKVKNTSIVTLVDALWSCEHAKLSLRDVIFQLTELKFLL